MSASGPSGPLVWSSMLIVLIASILCITRSKGLKICSLIVNFKLFFSETAMHIAIIFDMRHYLEYVHQRFVQSMPWDQNGLITWCHAFYIR